MKFITVISTVALVLAAGGATSEASVHAKKHHDVLKSHASSHHNRIQSAKGHDCGSDVVDGSDGSEVWDGAEGFDNSDGFDDFDVSVGSVGFDGSADAPASDNGGGFDWRVEMLNAINEERSKAGRTPLCANRKLTQAATHHAEDMAAQNYFSHTSLDGRSFGDRIANAGFAATAWGENIAIGQVDVVEVMNDWMHSPPHRENILRENFRMVGFGMTDKRWVQNYGTAEGEQCD